MSHKAVLVVPIQTVGPDFLFIRITEIGLLVNWLPVDGTRAKVVIASRIVQFILV